LALFPKYKKAGKNRTLKSKKKKLNGLWIVFTLLEDGFFAYERTTEEDFFAIKSCRLVVRMTKNKLFLIFGKSSFAKRFYASQICKHQTVLSITSVLVFDSL
jgi:hypothetical protein